MTNEFKSLTSWTEGKGAARNVPTYAEFSKPQAKPFYQTEMSPDVAAFEKKLFVDHAINALEQQPKTKLATESEVVATVSEFKNLFATVDTNDKLKKELLALKL